MSNLIKALVITLTLILGLSTVTVRTAVFNFTGAESGSTNELDSNIISGTGTVTASTTSPLTGTYSYDTDCPAGTDTCGFRLKSFSTTGNSAETTTPATVYITAGVYPIALPAANSEPLLATGVVSTGNLKGEVRIDSSGTLHFYDSTSTLAADAVTGALSLNTWTCVKVKIGTGASGEFEVLVNDVQVMNGTANLNTTNNARIMLGKWANRNSNAVHYRFDNIALDDSAYIPCSAVVKVLVPKGAGNASTWTPTGGSGADYERTDEIPPNSTDYILSTLNIGDAHTFDMTDNATSGVSGTIHSVKSFFWLRRETATGSVLLRLRSGTTNADTGAVAISSSTLSERQLIHNNDPATGAAWASATPIDTVQLGVVENSNTATANTRASALYLNILYNPSGGGGGGSTCLNKISMMGIGGCN